MATLTLKNVVKRFDATTVIHNVDLEVADGEFVVFVGPSGCGKSTLLRMISGLEPVSGGELVIDGKRVNEVSAAERGLAMVFQSYALYPHMTVYQNLAFGLENIRTPKAEIESKVQHAAKMLQLDQLLGRRPTQLSGGQRQRVAIGRAIVRDPTIFLFDEPLSNLDAELRVQMRGEIIALHERLGTTMIYVTHDQVEAMTMADKIVVLQGGRIEQVGAPLELYNRPANRFVAGFIGSPRMNFLKATVREAMPEKIAVTLDARGEDKADTAEGATIVLPFTSARPGDKLTLGVRPEHLVLTQNGAPDGSTLTMTIKQIEQLGAQSFLYGELGSGERVVAQIAGQLAQHVGDRIRIGFAAADTHVFRLSEGEPALPRSAASAESAARPAGLV